MFNKETREAGDVQILFIMDWFTGFDFRNIHYGDNLFTWRVSPLTTTTFILGGSVQTASTYK